MRLLLILLLLSTAAQAENYRAGSASGTWLSDSSIATGGSISPIVGASVPYNSHRWGSFTLSVPVSGAVSVKLHFKEPWASTGQRIFHIEIEGQRVETNFDVASVGISTVVRTYTANVTDGALTVKFIDGGPDDPMYSAIEVTGGAPPPPPPPVVTGEATLTWTAPTGCAAAGTTCAITGYRIEYGIGSFDGAVTLGNVLTYTFTALPAGTYQFRLVSLSGTFQSVPSAPVTKVVTGTPTCPAKPADVTRTQSCPSGTTGSWTQTQGWTSAAFPTCWTAGTYQPTNPPAGACPPIPQPVNCVASAPVWVSNNDWTPAACPASGMQTGTETGTRTITTPPANGGTACPPLTQTRAVTRTCVPAGATWTVQPRVEVHEAVLDSAGKLSRGNIVGQMAAGKPCGAEAFAESGGSFRDVTEADVTLDSPSYRGRRLVALCQQQ